MANYAYVDVPLGTTAESVEKALRSFVEEWLPGWEVREAPWEVAESSTAWVVCVPDSAVDEARANKRLLAPNQDVGFPMEFNRADDLLEFRHSPNSFENWAQGIIQECFGEHFGTGVFFDATDRTYPPETRHYRDSGKRFYSYVTRNMPKPLSLEDIKYLDERYAAIVPEGHWRRGLDVPPNE